MPQPPNVLIFFTDDQRFDTLHALGNSEVHTPNLDALVAAGTTFTRAHIPGGTVAAVCMPSRAMLHTGRTLFHLERDGERIPSDHVLLGEHFREAGYTTFGTGKWHNGREAYARSFSAGGEIFFGGMGDHWNVPAYRFDPSGHYERRPFVADPFYSNQVEYRDGDHIEIGTHSTDLFTRATRDFLAQQPDDQPFLAYVSLMAPHDPRTMPAQFLDMYNPDEIALPPNFATEHQLDTGALRVRDELLAEFPRDPAEIRRHIAEYYAMISHLDAAFGEIVGTLRAQNRLENTVIVFAGDNGLALGQHGLMGKQNLYDHSVRVPLIFAGPGIPPGQQSDALVYLLDIFPTLCDLTGLDTPASVEGHSLRPCLQNPAATVRDQVYLAYGDNLRGISNGRHKYIAYAGGESQLFDLENDPWEMNNLLDTAPQPPEAQTLADQLDALAAVWDDQTHPAGARFWGRRNSN